MAYAQWVVISVVAKGTSLSIKNANLQWGKFYRDPNKDAEISPDEINRMVIAKDSSAVIASCGRSDVASGTEGSFDIYDGETLIGNYYWECPWGSKHNTSIWKPSINENYLTQVTGGNLDSGALGNVTVKCVNLT